MELMSEKAIDCRPFFYPLSSIPAYRGEEESEKARKRNTVAYTVSPQGLNLPSGLNMTEDKVGYVCKTLQSIIKAASHKESCLS